MARINVIVKQTGQRGTIEQNEYNPNIYQLEQTTQKTEAPQVSQPTQQGGNIITDLLGGLLKPVVNAPVEALFQAGRFVTDPTYRKASLGGNLTAEEAQKVANQPVTLKESLLKNNQINKGDFLEKLLMDEKRLQSRGNMIKGALGDALQVGAYGIPVGATGNILKTFGQGAIASGAMTAGNMLSEKPEATANELVGNTLMSAGVGGPAGALVSRGLPALTKVFGKGLEKTGEALSTNAFVTKYGKPTITEGGRKIIKYVNNLGFNKAKDAEDLASMAFKTYSEGGNTLANQIKTASTKSVPIEKKALLEFIDSQINSQKLASNKLPWEAVKKDLAELPNKISIEDFYRIKQDIGLKPNWANIAEKSTNEAYAKTYTQMNKLLNEKLKASGMNDFVKLNQTISNAKKVLDFANKRAINVPGTRGIGLKDVIAGGAGLATGNPFGALGGILLNRVAGSPTVTNLVGKGASKTGEKLASTLPNKAGNVSSLTSANILQNLLGTNQSTQQNIPNIENQPTPQPNNINLPTGVLPTQQNQPTISKDELILLSLLDPKNASTYKTLYDLSGGDKKEDVKTNDAIIALDQLQNIYFGDKTKKEGSLSIGKQNVGLGGILPRLGTEGKKLTDQNYVDRLKTYDTTKSFLIGILNQARGAGVLNEGEYQTMVANMPNEYSTDAQATNYFTEVRNFLKAKMGVTETDNTEVLKLLNQ